MNRTPSRGASNSPELRAAPVISETDGAARRRLLESGAALFAKQGYAASSVRQIVSAARVTAPVLYYHFGSKEGLYRELLRAGWEALEGAWRGAAAADLSPRERLRLMLEAVLAYFRLNGDTARLLLGARHGPPQGSPSFASEPCHARLLAELQSLLTEGLHPGTVEAWEVEAAGWTVVGALSAVVHFQFRHPEQAPGPETLIGVADVVRRGLRPS